MPLLHSIEVSECVSQTRLKEAVVPRPERVIQARWKGAPVHPALKTLDRGRVVEVTVLVLPRISFPVKARLSHVLQVVRLMHTQSKLNLRHQGEVFLRFLYLSLPWCPRTPHLLRIVEIFICEIRGSLRQSTVRLGA